MTGVMIIYVLINYLDHIHVHRQLRPPLPFTGIYDLRLT